MSMMIDILRHFFLLIHFPHSKNAQDIYIFIGMDIIIIIALAVAAAEPAAGKWRRKGGMI